ncbi:MAG: hypothetical protein WAV18_04510 [Roseiarcus sp.]
MLATALVAVLGGTLAIARVQSARDEKKIYSGWKPRNWEAEADKDKLNAYKDKLKKRKLRLKRQLGEANRNLEAEKRVVISVTHRDQSKRGVSLEKELSLPILNNLPTLQKSVRPQECLVE